MESIKTRGLEKELWPLQRRIRRAFAMGRISYDDLMYLDKRLNEVEARIVEMNEMRDGEEVGDDG